MVTTATPPKKVGKFSTTVGLKIQMAVSGLFFIFFVLMHMYGNLKMFLGPEAYDHYAHWLRTDLGYPILMQGWALWAMRIGLLVALIAHVHAAAVLTKRNRAARGSDKYAVSGGKKKQQTYASRTMKYGGVYILLFLIFHILQFTVLAVSVGADNYKNMGPYERMVEGFSPDVWWMYVLYFIFIAFLALHVRHGAWSAMATIGASRRNLEGLYNVVATLIALALFVGFMAPPTAIMLGFIS